MKNYPDVIPMLSYEDGPAALDWLARAFGFRERTRMVGKDGRLGHGEMETGSGVIMLATPTPDYRGPRRHRESCEEAARWSAVPYVVDGVLVYVDDVNAQVSNVEGIKKSLAAVPALKPDELDRIAGGPAYRLDPQRTAVMFTHGDELYYAKLDGSPAVRLTKTPGAKEQATFSPDGRFVAFVRGGNLFSVDVTTQAERQLTTDGGGNVLNGLADWVYGEEVFNRRPQAYRWPEEVHA